MPNTQPSVEGGPTNRLDPAARARRERATGELLARYHRTGDQRDRDAIVERFMPLARRLAGRYNRRPDSLDDLTQVAALALVKAVDRFDPTRGIAFSSYAVPTIVGEIKRHFRDHGWAVRPPRALAERALRVEAVSREFAVEHQRAPTVAELCAQTELTEEEVLDALHAGAGGERELARRPRLQAGRGSQRRWATDRHRRGRLRDRRAARAARRAAARRQPARPRDPAHALLRGHDAGRDRRGLRGEPDAGLAPGPQLAGAHAEHRRDARRARHDDRGGRCAEGAVCQSAGG